MGQLGWVSGFAIAAAGLWLVACSDGSSGNSGVAGAAGVGPGGSGAGTGTGGGATGGASTGGAPSQQELADGTIGSSCGACQQGLLCVNADGVPNGYCTKECGGHPDCGQGAYCYADGPTNICLRACGNDLDCRPGYTCQGDPGITGCYPAPSGTGGTGGGGGGEVTAASIRGCWAMNGDITFQLWFDGGNYFMDISWNSLSGTITYDGNYQVGGGALYLNYSDGSNKTYGIQFDGQNLVLDGTPYAWAGENCS